MLNGQWQGGADPIVLQGARELQSLYFGGEELPIVPVEETQLGLATSNNVIGFEAISRQTMAAQSILRESAPTRLLTIGGGCDADLSSVQYMQELYAGDLAVLWIDAHGDINAPWESTSHLFYGMPLRALLGDCGEAFSSMVRCPLDFGQVVHLGGRDLDPAEKKFICENGIKALPVMDSDELSSAVLSAIEGTGRSHLYVHLDLDSLDPDEFPYVPLPVPDGLEVSALIPLLSELSREISLVGLGVFEYKPCGKRIPFLGELFDFAGEALGAGA